MSNTERAVRDQQRTPAAAQAKGSERARRVEQTNNPHAIEKLWKIRRSDQPLSWQEIASTGSHLTWQAVWTFLHSNSIPSCTLETALAIFFCTLLQASSDTLGFLPFSANTNYALFWTALVCLPLISRKWKPDESAWVFVALVILHCLFGPIMLMSDPFALVLLYDGIVLGKSENRSRFIFTALLIIVSWGALMVTGTLLPYSIRILTNFNAWSLSSAVSLSLLGLLCVIATIVAGLYRATSLAQVQMMREHNEMLVRSQQESRTAARLAERARLARDMHDVVAHTLSIIIIQSDAGRYAGVSNPHVALETLHTIESETHAALAQMGEIFTASSSQSSRGSLPEHDGTTALPHIPSASGTREPSALSQSPSVKPSGHFEMSSATGDSSPVAPASSSQPAVSCAPSYVGIENLVQEARNVSQGLYTISYTVHGEPLASMSERLQTVLYRTVQESLSNVRKYAINPLTSDSQTTILPHAQATHESEPTVATSVPTSPDQPVHVTIVETWREENGIPVVDLVISDDGRGVKASEDGHRTGYGLIGMRERIRALGGTLSYGAEPNGVTVNAARSPETCLPKDSTQATGSQAANSPEAHSPTTSSGKASSTDTATQAHGFSLHAVIPTQPGVDLLAIESASQEKRDANATVPDDLAFSPASSPRASVKAHSVRGLGEHSVSSLFTTLSASLHNMPHQAGTRLLSRLQKMTHRLEHFISWKAQHPLINSLPLVLLLAIAVLYFYDDPMAYKQALHLLAYLSLPLLVLPLLWRQRFPVSIATWVGLASTCFSLWAGMHSFTFSFVSLPDLVAFYAGLLYGEKKYRPLLLSLCVPVVLSDAFQEVMWSMNFRTDHNWNAATWFTLLFYITGDTVVAAIIGNLALLKKARGTDLALLHQKEQALLAARAREAELAARQERQRISKQMHEEIRDTLHAVKDACLTYDPQLTSLAARYPEGPCTVTPADQALISSIFSELAQIGRKALADMRALLDILRRNETAADQHASTAPLRPMDGTR